MDVRQQSGNLRDSRPRRPPPKRASERHEQTQVLRARTERFRMWSIVESTQKKDPPKGLWTSVGGGEKFTGACARDRKSTRLNSSHTVSSYAVFCLKKKTEVSPSAS